VLCVSRFAHCVKMMGRDMVGSFKTPQEIERRLQTWLMQFTSTTSGAAGESGARQPLAPPRSRCGEAGRARGLRLHHPDATAFPAGRGGRCLPAGHRPFRAEGRSMSTIGGRFQKGDLPAAIAAATAG
jgi:hypothetical protein